MTNVALKLFFIFMIASGSFLNLCSGDAFDFSSGLFDPQGKIRQIDYARKATERGSTLIGLCAGSNVVLACFKETDEERQYYPEESIWMLEDNLGVAGVGLRSDVQYLIQVAQQECLQHVYAWGTPIHPKRLGMELAETLRKRAGRASKRPLAAILFIAGSKTPNNAPRLYVTGTEGNFLECQAISAGRLQGECMKYLKANQQTFSQASCKADLIQMALRTLEHVAVGVSVDDLHSSDLQIGTISEGEPFRIYETEDIEHAIQQLKKQNAAQ
mmetsp:Transcript_13271/g.17495  ORF Transcript_13271/g.17495 Transcript_13271/m.17495 type:complete len:272 (+) Transcript_13271:77-892(+)|eukprot:CAMPEP_0117869612 /NCGR_PEP_ID=MMETSP0950-20121206/9348_1 /TAXON_ID=44440 /ORGANISM="Chattonella subsalsa, Strain CCMP2191" /LENGTH=271 /DNA_ID=CAMNT_0005721741 /DNA_START=1 /DNA_END=816 /DNA_ORIENTATION=-